ncbi:MAG: hypothetical protein ACI9MR_003704 [Myxococcota bacterium]|jgi:hypothetical protein
MKLFRAILAFSLCTSLAMGTLTGCDAEDTADKGVEDDLPADGKADSFRKPTEHGGLQFSVPSSANFTDEQLYHAWEFSLTGDAKVGLAMSSSERNLDTVMYLYHRKSTSETWGRYIARNDDADKTTVLSLIEGQRGEGDYRIIVKGYKKALRGGFTVLGSCDGAGCPAVDPGDGDYGFPESGGFTAECLGDVTNALRSGVRSNSTETVDESTRKLLTGVQRHSIELFIVLNDGSDLDLDDESLDMDVTFFEDGALTEVTTGGDWSFNFLFDGTGRLLAYHLVDQSPYTEWTCPKSNAPTAESPQEECTGATFSFLPHDLHLVQEFDANADAKAMATAATEAYRKQGGFAAGDTLITTGAFWESAFWGSGAAVSVEKTGSDAVTYLLGSDGDSVWILASETKGAWLTQCTEEHI